MACGDDDAVIDFLRKAIDKQSESIAFIRREIGHGLLAASSSPSSFERVYTPYPRECVLPPRQNGKSPPYTPPLQRRVAPLLHRGEDTSFDFGDYIGEALTFRLGPLIVESQRQFFRNMTFKDLASIYDMTMSFYRGDTVREVCEMMVGRAVYSLICMFLKTWAIHATIEVDANVAILQHSLAITKQWMVFVCNIDIAPTRVGMGHAHTGFTPDQITAAHLRGCTKFSLDTLVTTVCRPIMRCYGENIDKRQGASFDERVVVFSLKDYRSPVV